MFLKVGMAQEINLSRRERQAMDIVYAAGKATVRDIQTRLPGTPTYAATRVLMRRLADKGLVTYETDGPRYVYSAKTSRNRAGRAAVQRLRDTFFGGSLAATFTALLGVSSDKLSNDELDEIERLIKEARRRRR